MSVSLNFKRFFHLSVDVDIESFLHRHIPELNVVSTFFSVMSIVEVEGSRMCVFIKLLLDVLTFESIYFKFQSSLTLLYIQSCILNVSFRACRCQLFMKTGCHSVLRVKICILPPEGTSFSTNLTFDLNLEHSSSQFAFFFHFSVLLMGGILGTAAQFNKWYFGLYSLYLFYLLCTEV